MIDRRHLLIRPAQPGMGLRDPQTGKDIPDDARTRVPDNAFWRRRITNGDVVQIDEDPDTTRLRAAADAKARQDAKARPGESAADAESRASKTDDASKADDASKSDASKADARKTDAGKSRKG